MKTIKYLTPPILGLLLLTVAWLTIQSVSSAGPLPQITTNTPVYRFLDTAGDGTGTKNAIGSYAITAETFYVQPPAANVYAINRLVVSIEDITTTGIALYGATTVTNGVVIRRVSGSDAITLTDGVTLSTNLGWGRYCAVNQLTSQLQAVCDFVRPIRLNGDRSERLEIVLNDDFSGLSGHYFIAQGYKE